MTNQEKMKQVPLTDYEIIVVIKVLSNGIPEPKDQDILFNVINRLQIIARL